MSETTTENTTQTTTETPPPKFWEAFQTPELKDNASVKKFNDVESLAKSYVNLEKTFGKDKITVPDQHATDEDWRGVFSKLGLPENPDKYELKADGLDPEFIKEFKKTAHESGMLPRQVQKAVDWYTGKTKATAEAIQNQEK